MEQKPAWSKINLFYVFFVFWLVVLAHDYFQFQKNVQPLPYSQFLTDLDQGRVSEVVINGDRIQGVFKNAGAPNTNTTPNATNPADKSKRSEFVTIRVDDPTLTDRLRKQGVQFSAVPQTSVWKDLFTWLIPAIFIFSILSLMTRRFRNFRTDILSVGKSRARIYVEKDLKTRFSDVAGIDEVKNELEEIVHFLKDPKGYSKLGGRMPKGILLVGPPGTGKTLLARAVAGEANVPFFSINGSEFVEMFVGIGAARVRDLFEQARAQAPCIIFIDELDALGKSRGLSALTGSTNDEKEQTLNQLLAELDGFDVSKGIILLAATNRPEILDPALLRSGRFDRQIMVDKPDRKARADILKVHMKSILTNETVNIDTLAFLTAGFSGADLANLVNEAALIATRRNADKVDMKDFTLAIERITAGLERKSRVLGPEEKKRVAYHEMGHAVVALATGSSETVHKVSIIPRGMGALGYTFRRQTDDRYLMGKHELEAQLAMLTGGRAAEMIFFDDISTGAADDLDKATEIARAMITRYGMSETLGPATLEHNQNEFLGGPAMPNTLNYSERTAETMDREVRRLLLTAIDQARSTIDKYRSFVDECVSKLLIQETLDEDEIKSLWDKARQDAPPAKPSTEARLENAGSPGLPVTPTPAGAAARGVPEEQGLITS